MELFIIETREGDEYITSTEHSFTLKVIPPEKQADYEYVPYQVVGAVFAEDFEMPGPTLADFSCDEEFELAELAHRMGMDNTTYEFEGIDITYANDDVPQCNKALWLEAINYYCQAKLGKTAIWLQAYGYQYEFSERNCTPETLTILNSGDADYSLN